MAGSITPLPIMLEEEDQKIYDKLEAPKSIVVRYGYMKMVAELPYDGDAKPGCGSKLVIRSRRGIELAEMLTTTCPNSGCGSAVSRKDMLEYIENSGGKDYPFTNQGKVLRVATIEDMNEQAFLDERKPKMIQLTRSVVRELDLPMRVVDVELLLGGERIVFHYTSEQWVDFRDLVRRLAQEYQTRIEMHQVNARDEARIVADYEKCGQYCCCKQFLKVLKPVSMKSAKVQKATLDPSKISGRCGRLMCCLRYEDQTYTELRKRLPHRQTRVMTEDGPGTVIDSQILTQLVMVRMDATNQLQAYPVENIRKLEKGESPPPPPREPRQPREGGDRERGRGRGDRSTRGPRGGRSSESSEQRAEPREQSQPEQTDVEKSGSASSEEGSSEGRPKRRRRRRRRRGRGGGGEGSSGSGGGGGGGDQPPSAGS